MGKSLRVANPARIRNDPRMSRRHKGFNTPFANVALPEAPPADLSSRAAPAPTAHDPTDDTDSAEDIFLREMRGVNRLSGDSQRIEPKKTLEAEHPDEDALALAELEGLVRGEGNFDVEDSGEMVSGRASGVSAKTLNELKRGKLAFRGHIDLHGLTREAARGELNDFIIAARRDDQRCVLVVTGRGKSSPGGVSVLRETLPRWLSRAPLRPHVLAFCTARRVDGGPGAFYVLLRRAGLRPFGASG